MLLQQTVADGVAVLAVEGAVGDPDGPHLLTAVQGALALGPRGVVLDLAQAEAVSAGAAAVLTELARVPSGWPRAALVVCPSPAARELPGVLLAPDRAQAVATVRERSDRLRATLSVEHGPGGPAQARAAVITHADRLGLGELADDVVLLVSELVTNAIRHAVAPIDLEIEVDRDQVVVAVRDGSAVPPAPRDADVEAEGGRGMLLVDLLTAEHGVRPQPPGKTVWARLQRTPVEVDVSD